MRKICPAGVFESIDKKHPPQIKFLNSCIACGHCEAVCKHNAVISEPFLKIGCTTEIGDSFDSLLSSLRSVRNYKSQAISHQDFKTIVQSGYNVPTAQNIRKINIATYNDIEIKGIHDVIVKKLTTTKIVIPLLTKIIGVFDKVKGKDLSNTIIKLKRVLKGISKGQYHIFHHAPQVIVLHGTKSHRFLKDDCDAALNNIRIMAHSLGHGSCIIGFATAAER